MLPSQETLKLFISAEFLTGVAFGVGALGLGLLAARVWRRNWPVASYGLLTTAATFLAMPVAHKIPLRLVAGCTILAVAGAGFRFASTVPLAAAAVAVPGAVVVAFVTPMPEMGSVIWLIFALIVVGSPVLAAFDERYGEFGFGPVLLTLTVAAGFAVLPETSHVVVMLGVAIPLGFLGWPKVHAAVGGAGSYALMGVYAWVVASGGEARTSAIVGSVGALGIFVAEPLARRFVGARASLPFERYSARAITMGALLAHALVLGFAARAAGIRDTVLPAVVIAVAAMLLATGALVAMYRWSDGRRPAGISEAGDHGPV